MTDLAPLAARGSAGTRAAASAASAASPAPAADASAARAPAGDALVADAQAARRADLRRVATEFEAVFLAEMLTHAGVGRATPGFDGGAGEAAFASRLTAAQAQLMAERGGLGLGDALFEAMLDREGLAPAAEEVPR